MEIIIHHTKVLGYNLRLKNGKYHYDNFHEILVILRLYDANNDKTLIKKFEELNGRYINNSFYFKDKSNAIKAKNYFESYITMKKLK
jgi:hypothetical protein